MEETVTHESAIPKNSITEAILKNKEIDYSEMERLKEENERFRKNNLDLKMQIIDLREKMVNILQIINRK
jgi:hypothetical protein